MPADSAGEVTVIEVVELTTTPVPATVPNFTPVTPLKPVPVMVTLVPPAVDPEVTLRPVTVGAGGAVKVNWSAGLVALVPPAALTVTSTVPADSAGEVTVIEVVELTTTPVPATVPNFTPVTPLKPVPVMVTLVPPAVDPEVTLRPVTVGAGGGAPLVALNSNPIVEEVEAGDWVPMGATAPVTLVSKATRLPSAVTS